MKKITFILAMVLVVSTVLFAGGQSAGGQTGSGTPTAAGAIPSYINLDGYFPVVKNGTNVSVTVSWLPDVSFGKSSDPADIWWFRFVKEIFNIDMKVTVRAPGDETKNLMFASGDLPDIWLSGLNPSDIVNYGIAEKLITPISDYLNPTLMPNLYKLYNDQPDLKSPSVASDGKIYGFSNFRGKEWLHGPVTGGLARVFFNQKWLDQLGMKVPETLDQYIAVLRGFKSLGSDILPDAGIFSNYNSMCLLYSALGFHWTNANRIIDVGTRNGKATFIYGDKEIYPKFLETFKTMYDEGLISKDYFTMTDDARTAITMSGKAGMYQFSSMAYVNPVQGFDYVSGKPLTSEFNDKIFWVSASNYVVPNVIAITSKCKYPEAVCRMFDFNYTPENTIYMTFGYPDTMPQYQFGMVKGWTITKNAIDVNIDDPVRYESQNIFAMSRIRPINNMVGIINDQAGTAMSIYGMNPPKEDFDLTNVNDFSRKSTYENLSPYAVTEFPFVVYWDAQTSKRISDLAGVINDYATIQFAQFVTGARPLSDLNNYFAELDKLNYQEYLKYFVDYYDKVKTAK